MPPDGLRYVIKAGFRADVQKSRFGFFAWEAR
jgi:hypothetical protein